VGPRVEHIGVGARPFTLVEGDGSIWVANFGDGSVARLDPATNRIVARVQVGGQPWGLAAGEGSVWVGNYQSTTVARIDTATNAVVARTEVGDQPIGLAYADGSVWAADFGDGALTRIDSATNAVAGRTVVPGEHEDVAVAFGAIWVANEEGTVSRVDPATGAVTATVRVGLDPDYLLVAEGSVWTTAYRDRVISRIDPATNTVAASLAVPSGLQGIASDQGTFWAANYDEAELMRLDPATGGVLARVGTGAEPRDVLVAAGSVWVANSRASTVTRVTPRSAVRATQSAARRRRPPYVLRRVAAGLAEPVYVTSPPGTPRSLYVVVRGGVVRAIVNGRLVREPFLDLRGRVRTRGEGGLLSITFAPDYAASGRVYAAFTTDEDERPIRIVEYRAFEGRVDPATERPLVRVPHPDSPYHYGGQLAFGPDGKLYAGVGDGGYLMDGARLVPDPHGNAQNLGVLLGKLFRLDPSEQSPAPEIVAYGLRNPWRFSFDAASGDLIIGDVGWNAREEVDVLRSGTGLVNFGWSVYEGRGRGPTRTLNPSGTLVAPALTYATHANDNCAITGGYVYRGRAVPRLRGRYVFGDYCSGRIWSAAYRSGRLSGKRLEPVRVRSLASFGQDAAGELYAVSLGGRVFRFSRR
jgi:YVTN family beta-propeller protein